MHRLGEGVRMQRPKNHIIWRSGIRAIPGTLVVGAVTLICYSLRLDLTVTAFLYLILVVLQSLSGDFTSSAIVSVMADLCLNFFFCSSPFLVPSERLLGLLGADRFPDHRAGHHTTHDEGAPRDRGIGTAAPRDEVVIPTRTTAVRFGSARGTVDPICRIVSDGVCPAGGVPI